ncbi:MAG: hydrogenase maturation protease [Thermodesulfobacteriota bacterium]
MYVQKTLIVGVGNLLLQDEGIGVHVIQALRDRELPAHVDLLDMGTATMNLAFYLDGVQKVIIVDALKAGQAPGTIYQCRPEDLIADKEGPVSLHDLGVLESLSMSKRLGYSPEVVIIGVEPRAMDWGMELTDEVQKQVPAIIDIILKECQRNGGLS